MKCPCSRETDVVTVFPHGSSYETFESHYAIISFLGWRRRDFYADCRKCLLIALLFLTNYSKFTLIICCSMNLSPTSV